MIPNFGEIFGLLINPFLVKKISRKNVILTGLALVMGCIVLGAGFGLVMLYIFKYVSLSVPDRLSNLATTLCLCLIMMDIGPIISPFIISIIAKNSDKALLSSAIFFDIVTLIAIVRNIYTSLKHNN